MGILRRVLKSALLIVGSTLIVSAVALVATSFASQWLHDQQSPTATQESLPASLNTAEKELPISRDSGSDASVASQSTDNQLLDATSAPAASAAEAKTPIPTPPISTATSIPEPTAVSTPAAARSLGRPVRLVIPSIHLDTPVDPTGIQDGVYQVPWWNVGWQEDSALLGEPGNTVLNGHVLTIDAGKVFYHLKELQQGDLVYVYSHGYRTTWVVDSSRKVSSSSTAFIAPTEDTRLTLYTCDGSFDWKTRTYSDYRVVIAHLLKATPTPQP